MKYGYPKTYAFFKKHSSKIWILIALALFKFILVPGEKRHYLVSDIDNFSDAYYKPICIVLSVLIVFSTFFIVWWKGTIRKAFISLIPGSFIAFCISLFFHSIIIGTCLMINRFSREKQVKYTYVAMDTRNEFGLIITEVQTNRILSDEDVSKMELYCSESYLQSSDTFNYTFNKGLLGIKYIPDKK